MIYLNIASEFSDEVFFFKPASESWLYKTSKNSEILFSFRPWSDFFRNYWLAFFHQSRNRETRSQNFEGSKVLKKCFIFVSHSHFRSFLLWLLVWLLPSRSQSKTLDFFTCFSTEKSFFENLSPNFFSLNREPWSCARAFDWKNIFWSLVEVSDSRRIPERALNLKSSGCINSTYSIAKSGWFLPSSSE